MKATKWARLGKTAAAEGKTRTRVIDELTDWYLRDRPTSQLSRPERVELTADEIAALAPPAVRVDDEPRQD